MPHDCARCLRLPFSRARVAVADPNLIISKATDNTPSKVCWQAAELIVQNTKVIYLQRMAQVFYDHNKFLMGEVRRCYKEDVRLWVIQFEKECGKHSLPVEWVETTESLLKLKFPLKAAYESGMIVNADRLRHEIAPPKFIESGVPEPARAHTWPPPRPLASAAAPLKHSAQTLPTPVP